MASEDYETDLGFLEAAIDFQYSQEDEEVVVTSITIEDGFITSEDVAKLEVGPCKEFLERLMGFAGDHIQDRLDDILLEKDEYAQRMAEDWHVEQKLNEQLERRHGW